MNAPPGGGHGAVICLVGVLQRIYDHLHGTNLKLRAQMKFQIFQGACRNKPNISSEFEKSNMLGPDSRNRGSFSAISDTRPENLEPHL